MNRDDPAVGLTDTAAATAEHLLCAAGDVGPGAMKAVEAPGLPPLALFNVDGELFATSNVCTHQVALLTDGYFEGDCVECPMHGGSFNVRTGVAMSFPCTVPLQTFPVKVVDGQVYLVAAAAA